MLMARVCDAKFEYVILISVLFSGCYIFKALILSKTILYFRE